MLRHSPKETTKAATESITHKRGKKRSLKTVRLDLSSELTPIWEKLYQAIRGIEYDDEKLKSFAFSSARTGEGVSTIAFHSAVALRLVSAEKVLLVDANMRNPVLHRSIGTDRSKGLVELTEDNSRLSEIIVKEESRGVFLLTSGRPVESPAAFFQSDRFSRTLHVLEKQFDSIVFDSAPVLTSPETAILASKLNGLVLVIHADATNRETVSSTLHELKSANANVLGAVLNRKRYYIPNFIYQGV